MNSFSTLDRRLGMNLGVVCAMAACLAIGNALSADTSCDAFALAGCSVGKPLSAAKDLFPSAQLEPQADGTVVMTVEEVKDALVGAGLGTGKLRVVFDQKSTAREVWFLADTDRTEEDLLNAVKKIWGDKVEVHHYHYAGKEGGHEYAMNASWGTSCAIKAKLNIVIEEKPARTSIAVGLVREKK